MIQHRRRLRETTANARLASCGGGSILRTYMNLALFSRSVINQSLGRMQVEMDGGDRLIAELHVWGINCLLKTV